MRHSPYRSASPDLRTLLVLGRVSNVPTVWSNCIAAWLLGGAGELWVLLWTCAAATFLYVGGMYLNDAFDANFDRQFRRERPIPSGRITEQAVWNWGFFWLTLGTVILLPFGRATVVLTALLLVCILIYDAIHKAVAFSPLLMAMCRFLLFLVAASLGEKGVTGLAIWSAAALAIYIVGLSYIARRESARGPFRYWPAYLLATPVLLALVVNVGPYRAHAVMFSLALMLWVSASLRWSIGTPTPNIGRTVSGLLGGIVLVDTLAVLGGPTEFSIVFAGLFVAALLFQRFIPAT